MAMTDKQNSEESRPLLIAKRPPHMGEVAAAKFIIKRVEEGKSDREITPLLRWLANYGQVDESRVPDIVLHPEDNPR